MAIVITAKEKQLLQSVTIPPRPQTLLTVSAEAKKAEPDVSVVAEAIAADLGISAAVLQVVNSAAYRRANEIESIQQAVMTLGLKRIFPLVRAVALKSTLAGAKSLDDFWDYNERVAGACVIVAEALGKAALKDHAYMLGLFQSSGVPVMLAEFDGYADIIADANEQPWFDLIEREREQYDTANTTVGALLAQQWKLPKVLVQVIYYLFEDSSIYYSNELSRLGLDLLSIVKVARYAVDMKLRPDAGEQEWTAVQEGVMEHFQLDEFQLEELTDTVAEEVFDLA